jgi:hypothetical protein
MANNLPSNIVLIERNKSIFRDDILEASSHSLCVSLFFHWVFCYTFKIKKYWLGLAYPFLKGIMMPMMMIIKSFHRHPSPRMDVYLKTDHRQQDILVWLILSHDILHYIRDMYTRVHSREKVHNTIGLHKWVLICSRRYEAGPLRQFLKRNPALLENNRAFLFDLNSI